MARVCVANCNFGYLLQNAASVKKTGEERVKGVGKKAIAQECKPELWVPYQVARSQRARQKKNGIKII